MPRKLWLDSCWQRGIRQAERQRLSKSRGPSVVEGSASPLRVAQAQQLQQGPCPCSHCSRVSHCSKRSHWRLSQSALFVTNESGALKELNASCMCGLHRCMRRLAQTAQGPGASAPDAQFATDASPAKAQKLGKLRCANAPGAFARISCRRRLSTTSFLVTKSPGGVGH